MDDHNHNHNHNHNHIPYTGRFVWHDLMTNDIEKSVHFYTKLLGWNVVEQNMGAMGTYHMIMAGERKIGGFMKTTDHNPHWMGYVGVQDVNTTVNHATKAGGHVVMAPMEIPGVGMFSTIKDPTGGTISLVNEYNPQVVHTNDMPVNGMFCWDELQSTDTDLAAKFYQEILPWTTQTMTSPDNKHMTVFKQHGKYDVAGLYNAPADHNHTNWMTHILVEDLTTYMTRATELGATVLMNETEVPNLGKFSIIQDPVGAVFAMFQWNGNMNNTTNDMDQYQY